MKQFQKIFLAHGSSWRDLVYELSLISEATVADFVLSETDLLVNITSGMLYTASVRACTVSGICSEFINATNTAFGPYKEAIPVVIYTKNGEEMNMIDLLGEELKDTDGYCKFYPEQKKRFLDPILSPDNEKVLAWENTTKTLYAASSKEISIWREFFDGESQKFLDYVTVNHISIMPKRSIILLGSSYMIAMYKLTSSFEQM